ncbi:MAG: hypothetical protein JNN12_15360 [Bacteroidetes Order II. Incertae sedis bacterium]|nr:hypothetical protein [Bacteroidetes Order II. bacterium]
MMTSNPNHASTPEPPPAQPVPRKKNYLSPLSGGLILLLDNLLFGSEFFSLGLNLPLSMTIGFLGAGLGVYYIQRKKEGDGGKASLFKALMAGAVTGFPTSISGSIVGTGIMLLSGLSWLRNKK